MSDAIARYYDATKQQTNAAGEPVSAHTGVPLRNLTDAEFAALPAWQQAEIDASPLYRKTRPTARARAGEPEAPSGNSRQEAEE